MTYSEENTLSNKSESDEVAQVQLRSGKVQPSTPKKGIPNKDKGNEIIINDNIIPNNPKKKDTSTKGIDYNILSHLRKISEQLSIYDAFIMPKEPSGGVNSSSRTPKDIRPRNKPIIIFAEDGIMFGMTDHQRPLYKEGNAVTSKTRRVVLHLGSDTEEDEVIPVKSKKICHSIAKGKKNAENSDFDYDYKSTYARKVQYVFSRRIGSLLISNSIFVVARLPPKHFKEANPREVHNVEELKMLYVPPLSKGTRP
ncbi:hypothetical protein M5K25_011245 [Dendrobium thyrsiflorum]|uniref:Uncharacterized protein n=1 Tax=Dendrobium thyrsiflorum TaxID=117978 RepID=A0ABD0V298_DENTH